jgi:cytochrome bd-type quinol oxidase subunit 2
VAATLVVITRSTREENVMHRSRALLAAIWLNAFVAVVSIAFALVYLPRGADELNQDYVPYPVIVLGLVLGVLGLVSSYGLWRKERWGLILTMVVQILQILSGAPGVIFGPDVFTQVSSVVLLFVNVAGRREPVTS